MRSLGSLGFWGIPLEVGDGWIWWMLMGLIYIYFIYLFVYLFIYYYSFICLFVCFFEGENLVFIDWFHERFRCPAFPGTIPMVILIE